MGDDGSDGIDNRDHSMVLPFLETVIANVRKGNRQISLPPWPCSSEDNSLGPFLNALPRAAPWGFSRSKRSQEVP
jgi:hypothetical protein